MSAVFLLSLLQLAGTPLEDTLLVDINQNFAPVDSDPWVLASIDDGILFSAVANGLGRELYFSDGTDAGTTLVLDAYVGSSSGYPEVHAELTNGLAIFSARAGIGIERLYAYDASSDVTTLLTGVDAPVNALSTSGMQTGDHCFFIAQNDELWRTDGSVAGTELVYVANTSVRLVGTELLGSVLFADFNPGVGYTLKLTSGEPGAPITTIADTGFLYGSDPIEVGGRIVLNTQPLGGNQGWYSTDGTPGPLELLALGDGDWSETANGQGFFTSFDAGVPGGTRSLWSTNGTGAGTQLLDDVAVSGLGEPSRGRPLSTDQGLVFAARVAGGSGWRVWGSGGAPLSTFDIGGQVFDKLDAGKDAYLEPGDFTLWNGEIYFAEAEFDDAYEEPEYQSGYYIYAVTTRLWSIDPTGLPPQAQEVALISGASTPIELGLDPDYPDMSSGPGMSFGTTPISLAFAATSSLHGSELWSLDAVSIEIASNLMAESTDSSSPKTFRRNGAWVYFVANDGQSGPDPWRTDGTAAGTSLVADVSGFSTHFVYEPFGDRMPFLADSQLYITDGSAAGTIPLTTQEPSPDPYQTAAVGDTYFFAADGPSVQGPEVWTSDGTAVGTAPLGVETGYVQAVFADGDRAYVSTIGSLWSSDGTPGGTQAEPVSGIEHRFITSKDGDQFWFRRHSIFLDLVRYRPSDQTLEVLDSWNPDGSANHADFDALESVVVGETIYYYIEDSDNHRVKSRSLLPGSDPVLLYEHFNFNHKRVHNLARCGNDVVFEAETYDDNGLRTTAGLVGSTALVVGPYIPKEFIAPFGSGAADAFLYLGPSGQGNTDLFHFDLASSQSTQLTQFTSQPSAGAVLEEFAQINGRILVSASTPATGIELHSIALPDAGASWVEHFPGGCGGADGTPNLELSGFLTSGGSATLSCGNQEPGALLLTAFGLQLGPLGSVGTCTVSLVAPQILFQLPADVTGLSSATLPLPSAAILVGLPIYLQGVSIHSGGPFLGLGSLSNALEAVIGI